MATLHEEYERATFLALNLNVNELGILCEELAGFKTEAVSEFCMVLRDNYDATTTALLLGMVIKHLLKERNSR